MAKRNKSDAIHSLLSIAGPQLTFHGYLMCERERLDEQAEWVLNMLFDRAQTLDSIVVPMACHTVPLTEKTIAEIRAVLSQDPEAATVLGKATTQHVSLFHLPTNHPVNKWLMEIH